METTTLIAEVTLHYSPRIKPSKLPQISTSKEAAEYFRKVWSQKISYIEESLMLLVNRANKILGYVRLSEGGTSGTVVDTKIVFQAAIKSNAHGFILCHNHPSGNLQPSESDRQLTRKLKQAGLLLDIQLLDHIILTQEGYYSFADEEGI